MSKISRLDGKTFYEMQGEWGNWIIAPEQQRVDRHESLIRFENTIRSSLPCSRKFGRMFNYTWMANLDITLRVKKDIEKILL